MIAHLRGPNLLIIFYVIAGQAVLPFIPVIAQQMDLDAAAIGLLLGVQGFAGLIAIAPIGVWMGQRGAHRFAQWAALGALAAFLGLWLAPSHVVLFVSLAVLGASQMAAFMAGQMIVVTIEGDRARDRAVGMFLFYTSVGVTLGPLLGSLAVRLGGLDAVFVVGVATSAIAVVTAYWLTPTSTTPSLPPARLLSGIAPLTPSLRVSILTTGVGDFLYVAWSILLPLALTAAGQNPSAIGWAFGLRGAMTMLVRPLLPALLVRFTRDGLVAVSLVALGGGFWLSAAFSRLLGLSLLGSALFGVGTGLLFPLSLLLLTSEISAQRLPSLLGFRQFVGRLGQIAGPVVTGILVTTSQSTTAAGLGAISLGAALWIYGVPGTRLDGGARFRSPHITK